MRTRLLAVLWLLMLEQPIQAQSRVAILGRVEDAVSRVPLAGARVVGPDSAAVFTDSLGSFAMLMRRDAPLEVMVEQYGYRSQRFELGSDPPTQIFVLLLEPAPIELEGIAVVEEAELDRTLRSLTRRRNAFEGAISAYEGERLRRLAGPGSAWDFVRARVPMMFSCSSRSGLCVRGRSPTLQNPFPTIPVQVCIDGWESWSAASELGSLDMAIVSLVEIYARGRGGIRVYTGGYIASAARRGRNIATPLRFGC